MRVAIACDWFLKVAAAQAQALVGRGVEVLLLCRNHPFEFGGDPRELRETIEQARAGGVRVVEMPGRLWDPLAVPALMRIRRDVARFRPDVIHVHDRVDPRAIALLPWRTPSVLTIHDPTPHPGQQVARLAPKRWVLEGSRDAWRRRARALVVHSERLNEAVSLGPRQRCVVIPLGLDVHPEPLPAPAVPAVGFFGRLEPYKGLDVLARAMPIVWEHRPEVRLNVAGKGPTDFPLADPRVDFQRRYLPEGEMERFFRATSIAAIPYTEASQSAAGGVAIGYGVPIVATRLGGLPDLALDDSYLVPAGDERALAAAIVAHIDDGPDVRARVLAEIAGPRSWDSCAALGVALYEDLLAGR